MTDNHKTSALVEKGVVAVMHPMVEAAIAQNPDAATLRELLEVQREWEAGEAKRAFTRALVALKRDLPTVIDRDKLVDFKTSKGRTTYTHTSLAGIMDAITEPLTQHGFSIAYKPSTSQGQVTVVCVLTHAEGHSEECSISSPTDNSGSKGPAQAIASTITLLSRYTCLALLGIATNDMKEPSGETTPPSDDSVDPALNLKAAAKLKSYEKTREQAEELLGRKVKDWTRGDLGKLRAWLIPEKKSEGAEPQEPPHDPETGETHPGEWDGVGPPPWDENQTKAGES